MPFDPFGDFATRGYLRNFAGEKDPEAIKHLEH
jgi:cell filamentation protein